MPRCDCGAAAEARRRAVRRAARRGGDRRARRRSPSGADLLLCVGSSLEVYPVAGLPELTLAAGGRSRWSRASATPFDRCRRRAARRRRGGRARGGAGGAVTPTLTRRYRGALKASRARSAGLDAAPARASTALAASTEPASAACGRGGVTGRPQARPAPRAAPPCPPSSRHTSSSASAASRAIAELQRGLARAAVVEVAAGAQGELLAGERDVAAAEQGGDALLRARAAPSRSARVRAAAARAPTPSRRRRPARRCRSRRG